MFIMNWKRTSFGKHGLLMMQVQLAIYLEYLNGGTSWSVITIGPRYGYNPNPNKCVLMTKNSEIQRKAQEMFGKFGMEITTTGKHHLGAAVRSTNFKAEYMQGLVTGWVDDVKLLANIAQSEPQCAYTAMTNAIQHGWKFVQQTIPDISAYIKELEFEIQHTLNSSYDRSRYF